MSTIEDRLTRALEARTEQVQPEDLRPAEVPAPKVSWLRHPATYAVAAAACAAAIAVPFVVDLGEGDPSPTPPVTTPTPSQTLPPQEDVGGSWPAEFGTTPVDVDGDGVKDKIRVRHEPGKPLVGPRARIEVDLSATGTTAFGVIDSFEGFVNVAEHADLDGDGMQELTIYRDDTDYRNGAEPFAVLTLTEDRLVEVPAPATPLLATGTIVEPDTGRGYQSRTYVDDNGLHSFVTTDTYSGIEPLNLPAVYPVQVTSWSMVDGALVPSDDGVQCIDILPAGASDLPVPCPEGYGPEASPTLFPEQQDQIGVGESFDVALGSVTFTVGLEADGSELVVDVLGGGERRLTLPDGEAPEVYTTPVDMSGAGDLALLVAQQGPASTEMTLVILQRGGLVATLTEGPVPFGNGRLSVDAGRFQTWIGPDNVLHTAVATIESDEEYDVYRWALGGTVSMGVTPTLQPQRLGCFAIDLEAPDGDVTPC
jgi:hypothetical protein